MRFNPTFVRTVASVVSVVLCGTAGADFIGWTSTERVVSGGYLYNVFAVTNSSTDVILNVSGGFITTNSAGGFRQDVGASSAFAPAGDQNVATLDSFLTLGGGVWSANPATQSDGPWFTTPGLASVPAAAGWFVSGSTSPARSLTSLPGVRLPYQGAAPGGAGYGASSASAASGTHGFLVGQLFVVERLNLSTGRYIDWKASATLRRADSTTTMDTFSVRIQEVPAPCVAALIGVAAASPSRRRR